MKTTILIILTSLIFLYPTFSQDSKELFRQGNEKLETADYEEAFKLFNQAALADDKICRRDSDERLLPF
jgi:hypothetical protein